MCSQILASLVPTNPLKQYNSEWSQHSHQICPQDGPLDLVGEFSLQELVQLFWSNSQANLAWMVAGHTGLTGVIRWVGPYEDKGLSILTPERGAFKLLMG